MNKVMKAERDRRAAVTEAEGEKRAAILTAEGRKESQVLDATGEAEALKQVADAQKYEKIAIAEGCLLYTSPSPRDKRQSRMPSSA